jgi:hypothetical protein
LNHSHVGAEYFPHLEMAIDILNRWSKLIASTKVCKHIHITVLVISVFLQRLQSNPITDTEGFNTVGDIFSSLGDKDL